VFFEWGGVFFSVGGNSHNEWGVSPGSKRFYVGGLEGGLGCETPADKDDLKKNGVFKGPVEAFGNMGLSLLRAKGLGMEKRFSLQGIETWGPKGSSSGCQRKFCARICNVLGGVKNRLMMGLGNWLHSKGKN